MSVVRRGEHAGFLGSLSSPSVFGRLIVALAFWGWALPGSAQFFISPDNTVNVDGLVIEDDQLYLRNPMGAFSPVPLPANVELAGYDSDGTAIYFSIDITAVIEGITVESRDVAKWDGSTVSLELDGDTVGIPNGVRIDAVALSPTNSLFISLDSSANVAGLDVDDEDLFGLSPPLLLFNGEKNEIDPSLDLNGALFPIPDFVVLTFDGSGSVGGFEFNDEDLLAFSLSDRFYEFGNTSSGSPELEAIDVTAVPEPGISGMLAGAILGMACRASRRHPRSSSRKHAVESAH